MMIKMTMSNLPGLDDAKDTSHATCHTPFHYCYSISRRRDFGGFRRISAVLAQ